jgi:hypothetical protein
MVDTGATVKDHPDMGRRRGPIDEPSSIGPLFDSAETTGMGTSARDWLTPAQASQLLGVTPQRVRQMADAGQITCERTPLGRLLDPESVERVRDERRRRGAREVTP